VASQSIIQDFEDGSFIKIGKFEKCNDDEYVLRIVEADNKSTSVWLSETALVKLKNHIEDLIRHKLQPGHQQNS
jgi:hypothetical protein